MLNEKSVELLPELTACEKDSSKQRVLSAINQLRKAAIDQLLRLKNQKQSINIIQSSLNRIMKKHDANQSYLTLAANGFGERSWWIKLCLTISVHALAIIIGALSQMMLAMIICTSVIYFATIFLLLNHYKQIKTHKKDIETDIRTMETTLNESIIQLNDLSKNLDRVLIELCEKNNLLATNIERLESNITALHNKLQELTNFNQILSETQSSLLASTTSFGVTLKQSEAELETLDTAITRTHGDMPKIFAKLENTQINLSIDEETLQKVCESLETNSDELTKLTQNAHTLFSTLKSRALKREETYATISKTLQQNMTQRLDNQLTTESIIAHASDTIISANIILDIHDKTQEQNKQQTKDLSDEIDSLRNSQRRHCSDAYIKS